MLVDWLWRCWLRTMQFCSCRIRYSSKQRCRTYTKGNKRSVDSSMHSRTQQGLAYLRDTVFLLTVSCASGCWKRTVFSASDSVSSPSAISVSFLVSRLPNVQNRAVRGVVGSSAIPGVRGVLGRPGVFGKAVVNLDIMCLKFSFIGVIRPALERDAGSFLVGTTLSNAVSPNSFIRFILRLL